MRYVLDTDSFSGIVRQEAKILAKVNEHREAVFLSAVTIREAVRGAPATVVLAESGKTSLPTALKFLTHVVEVASRFPVLHFDEESEKLVQSWPKYVFRIGPNDCRIAASAIVHNAVVVTSNTKDYDKIRVHAGYFQTVDWRI